MSFWHYLFIIITIVTIITIFVVNILIIMIMIVITTCSKTCEVLLAIVGVWKPVVVPKAQHAANIRIRIIFDEGLSFIFLFVIMQISGLNLSLIKDHLLIFLITVEISKQK